MKAVVLYRTAAVLLLLFAAGHTAGFLSFQPPTPEARAVLQSMYAVHFTGSGHTVSYGGFYTGFGLVITLSYLFTAFLAWQMGSMAKVQTPGLRSLTWALLLFQVCGLVLSLRYFGWQPAVLSALLALVFAAALWSLRHQPA